MKITILKTTTLGLASALALIGSLSAIERPGQKKAEKLPADVFTQVEARGAQKNITWLGILTEPVSDDLAFHLKLDSGVIIRVVDPASPAAEAGLQELDIILKVGDLGVQNREQVKAVITAQNAGAEVVLKIHRQGKILDLKVRLGEREFINPVHPGGLLDNGVLGLAEIVPGGMNDDDVALLQQELLKRVEKALKGGQNGLAGQMPLNLNDLLNGTMPQGEDFHLGIQSAGSFSLSDEQGTIEMNIENGDRTVKVTNPEGKVLFEGPYTTDVDKESVPEEYRKRIDSLGVDGSGAIELQFESQFKAKGE